MTWRTPGLGVEPAALPDRDPAGADVSWDESARPHGPEPDKNALYTEAGRAEARSLVEVHGQFRHELARLREHVAQATADASRIGPARSALNALSARRTRHPVIGRLPRSPPDATRGVAGDASRGAGALQGRARKLIRNERRGDRCGCC
jgi:hypothetical protein